jgi:hypothetical protein
MYDEAPKQFSHAFSDLGKSTKASNFDQGYWTLRVDKFI